MFSIYHRPRNHPILLLLLFASSIHAYFLQPHLPDVSSSLFLDRRDLEPRSLSNAVPLRILCVGASVTFGFRSSDGNGYRYALRGKLVEDGNDVNMIGQVSHGNMSNNEVDGFPGLRIDQVNSRKNLSLELMPNVVLIELGTNDMTQNYSISTAHQRLGALIGRIVNAVPNVTVVVGTLIPNANPLAESNALIFNQNLVGTVAGLAGQGYKVSLVDFHNDWWSLSDIGSDGTHPTDLGYLKMARVWYAGIVAAAKAGNVTAPKQVAGVDDYQAGNDSSTAGTAMNVVCQNVNSSISAQVQQCSGAGRLRVLNILVGVGLFIAGAYIL